MASREIFGLVLGGELFSVSCRLRLQIYELFNELTSERYSKKSFGGLCNELNQI